MLTCNNLLYSRYVHPYKNKIVHCPAEPYSYGKLNKNHAIVCPLLEGSNGQLCGHHTPRSSWVAPQVRWPAFRSPCVAAHLRPRASLWSSRTVPGWQFWGTADKIGVAKMQSYSRRIVSAFEWYWEIIQQVLQSSFNKFSKIIKWMTDAGYNLAN